MARKKETKTSAKAIPGHSLEDLIKRCIPFPVDGWIQGYFRPDEVICLYEHGAGLPISWDIEKSKKLFIDDPSRKVMFWFMASKEMLDIYNEIHGERRNDWW